MAGKHLPQADHRGRRNLLGAGAAISIICAAAFVVPTSSLPLKPALSLGTITQTAYAGERDRDGERSMRHHKRRQENADDEDNSAAVQKPVSGSDSDKGPDSGNKADTQQPCCRPGDLSGPARYPAEMQTSPKSAITYDASKNMLLLRLKLGADERREHGHEHGHEHGLGTLHQDGGRAGHGNAISREMLRALHQGEKAQEHEFGSPRPEGWHPVRSVVALDKTLAPVEKRLHKAVEAANPKTTTSVSKNKFAIAPLSFALDEILGVHLDEASIRRVEALGFKVERGADPLSNAGITRLTVPPGVDAIRARDMLRS
ncbi:MAG TPA: hypothetical protein VE986_01805, partial [Hyphomicrobiales bacterium]|nr:hypothetical protein [Hyphomicrobiales bacterium]